MPDDWETVLRQHGINPDELPHGAVLNWASLTQKTKPRPPRWDENKRQKRKRKTKQNQYEQRFYEWWCLYGDMRFKIDDQHQFHKTKEWAVDWAFPEQKVAVEIEGMTGRNGHAGGHRGINGYLADVEKYNALAEYGWMLVRIPTFWLKERPGPADRRRIQAACQQITTILKTRSKNETGTSL